MGYESIGIFYGGCNTSKKTFKKRKKLNTKINHKKYKTIKFSRYLK